MASLQKLIASSTGLKITYVGFAVYAIYTLVKFYSAAPNSSNSLIAVIGIIGPLGLMAALISMIVTGIRGARISGLKTWWTFWAFLGIIPFIAIAISIFCFAMLVESDKPMLTSLQHEDHLQFMGKKIAEMKSKKANPKLLSKVTKMYASETYYYKGEIIEYIDENGKTFRYEPNEKEKELRRDFKNMPQDIENAQKNRYIEVAIWLIIPIIIVAVSLLIPMKKTI